MDEPERAVLTGAGADVRLGDRVVSAEHDRDRTRGDDLGDRSLDRLVRPRCVGGDDRRVAVVDHRQVSDRIHLRLEVRPRRTAGRANRTRAEARARPVGDEVVGRRPDDCDVNSLELGRVLGVRERSECEQARVIGLLPVATPALERVDHAANPMIASCRGTAPTSSSSHRRPLPTRDSPMAPSRSSSATCTCPPSTGYCRSRSSCTAVRGRRRTT